jgi:type I restriction enzyme S subunit
MNGIKPYTKYKPSGIAWLGDIPEHWERSKAKHILFQKKKTLNPNLNCGSISFGNIVFKDNERVPLETKATYQELLNGEFLINPLNLNFDLKSLRTGLSKIDVVVSTGYIVLQNSPNFNKRYLKWLLHQFDVSFMKTLGDGVRQTLSYTDFKNTDLPYITQSEQTAIANFLDYKTAKIDRFIFKKKQLIKLLNEQKAGIINDAVTKGLNPNAKTQPSGIEWLGDIPEHWEVSRMKNICTVRQGLQIPISDRLSEKLDGCFEYITIKSINNPENHREYILNPNKNVICKEEDILVVRTGGTGQVISNVRGVFHNNFFLVDYDRKKILKEYLCYYLLSPKIKAYLLLVAGTTTIPDLNHGEFYNTPFFEFDKTEQTAIVSHIEKETAIINKTIATIEKEIALVQEYRTALIAEAVTGKIDVRGYEVGIMRDELEETETMDLEDDTDFDNQELE